MTKGFSVVEVATGKDLGTATFDGQRWAFSKPSLTTMVTGKTEALAWSVDQVLAYYEDWSNGYIRTTAIP